MTEKRALGNQTSGLLLLLHLPCFFQCHPPAHPRPCNYPIQISTHSDEGGPHAPVGGLHFSSSSFIFRLRARFGGAPPRFLAFLSFVSSPAAAAAAAAPCFPLGAFSFLGDFLFRGGVRRSSGSCFWKLASSETKSVLWAHPQWSPKVSAKASSTCAMTRGVRLFASRSSGL